MPYISSWERIAQERGMEQGIEQGLEQGKEEGLEVGREQGIRKDKQDIILRILQKKFTLSEKEVLIVKNTEDTKILDNAIDALFHAETKDEVLKHLQ